MEIEAVSNNLFFPNSAENNSKQEIKSSEQKQDKFGISERAVQLSKASSDSMNIEEIKNRINARFYDSDEVIREISSQILKEIENI